MNDGHRCKKSNTGMAESVLVRAGPKDLLHTQNVIIYVISILVFVIRVLLGKRKEY